MQSLVVAPPSCHGSAILRPTETTPHTKHALTSLFLHKPRPTLATAPVRIRNPDPRQSNVVCALLDKGGLSGLLDKVKNKVKSEVDELSAPVWEATIYTSGALADDLQTLDFLDLELESESGKVDGEQHGPDLAKWKRKDWTSDDERKLGRTYSGKVRIATNIGRPSLARFTHKGGDPKSFYITRLVLSRNEGKDVITFPVNSWIHVKQKQRIFFDATPRLPSETSTFLEKFRKEELETLRGPPKMKEKEPRHEWDRTYQYDVYNDIGDPSDTIKERPVLGGRKDPDKLAYPRRIRTRRGLYEYSQCENPVSDKEEFWLPQDEKFDPQKAAAFNRDKDFYGLYAINGTLSTLEETDKGRLIENGIAVKSGKYAFPDFKAYNALFADQEGAIEEFFKTLREDRESLLEKVKKVLPNLGKIREGPVAVWLSSYIRKWDSFVETAKSGVFNVDNELEAKIAKAKILVDKMTFFFPFVYKDREEAWRTDEEWGRQALAGQNPCMITAISELPPGTTITAKQLEASMGGMTLPEAFASSQQRMFMTDYSIIYPEYTRLINDDKDRFQYAGRAILFLRDDGHLVPVAIELFTGEIAPVVYTPSDPPNVWLVAKHVFSSIDSGFHQVYSHFCRSHAVIEPACIATRRQLSALHPVYKLLMPHFRFTLNINRNARQTLINAGGVVESTFTPGKHAMTLSAEVYGRTWRFNEQALPNDLIERNMAKVGADGKLEVVLPDYPYAHDGLLVWEEMKTWVGEYLSLYYTGEPGKTIADDPEINAWWDEFRLEGHPDVTVGWPKMETVEDLTEILVTIIWLASAHHAAVNFGQYDYSGYMPNRSPIVHRRIPAKGSAEYKALSEDVDNFFRYFARSKEALQVMATIALLSTHAANEQYISDKEHFYIFDGEARAHYEEHVKRFEKIEEEIKTKNATTDSPIRSEKKGGLPYKLLMPSSKAGITGQGIPNSVSI